MDEKWYLFSYMLENINTFIMWPENIENLWSAIFAIFNNYHAISFQYFANIYIFLMGWKIMHL